MTRPKPRHLLVRSSVGPWTAEEHATLVAHYPDIASLVQLLPRRSRAAIRARAQDFDLTVRADQWTAAEVKRLRALHAAKATPPEYLAAFPTFDKARIERKLWRLGLNLRVQRERQLIDMPPIIAAVLARAKKVGLRKTDLAAIAREGTAGAQMGRVPVDYWKHPWKWKRPVWGAVEPVLEYLGGRIEVVFDE